MREEGEAEARTKLVATVRKHLPGTSIDFSTAGLIWLFGVLVYLPLAHRIEPIGFPLICGLTLLIGFSFFVFRGFGGLRRLLDATSDVLAYDYRRRRKKAKVSMEGLSAGVRCAIYVIAVLIIYALYSPLLAAIHPSLSGLTLIPIILWIFWMLFRAVTALGPKAPKKDSDTR